MDIKNKIIEEVSNYFNTTQTILFDKSRRYGSVQPRQIIQWLLRKYTKLTLKQIAQETNVGDHSTVSHAITNIDDLIYSKDTLVVFCLIHVTNKLNLNFEFENKELFVETEKKIIENRLINAQKLKEVVAKELGYKDYTNFKECTVKYIREIEKYKYTKRVVPKDLAQNNIKTTSHINVFRTIVAGLLHKMSATPKEISYAIEIDPKNVYHYVQQFDLGYESKYKKNLYINTLKKVKVVIDKNNNFIPLFKTIS